MTGTVSKFDDQRGWGFITADSGGGDFFVHYSEVKMTGHKSLFEGERVEFEIGNSQRGPKAVNVQPLDDGPEDHVTP